MGLENIYRSIVCLGIYCFVPAVCAGNTEINQFTNHSNSTTHLRICGDAVEWPPYTYQVGGSVRGYDVDVLTQAFEGSGYTWEIALTSWTRCLKLTKSGHYDIAVSAAYSRQRDADYLLTTPYYSIQPVYIFSPEAFPSGLNFDDRPAHTVKICGIYGYNYAGFNLPADTIKQESVSLYYTLRQLQQGECEAILFWQEILEGYKKAFNVDYLKDKYHVSPYPSQETEMHMMISRRASNSLQILSILNQKFTEMKEQGSFQKLLHQYDAKDVTSSN